jgi:hypothetical protein
MSAMKAAGFCACRCLAIPGKMRVVPARMKRESELSFPGCRNNREPSHCTHRLLTRARPQQGRGRDVRDSKGLSCNMGFIVVHLIGTTGEQRL